MPITDEKSDPEDEEQNQQCSKCGVIPDHYISLVCGHDFCLKCAIKCYLDPNLCIRELQGPKEKVELICEICTKMTVLD